MRYIISLLILLLTLWTQLGSHYWIITCDQPQYIPESIPRSDHALRMNHINDMRDHFDSIRRSHNFSYNNYDCYDTNSGYPIPEATSPANQKKVEKKQ